MGTRKIAVCRYCEKPLDDHSMCQLRNCSADFDIQQRYLANQIREKMERRMLCEKLAQPEG